MSLASLSAVAFIGTVFWVASPEAATALAGAQESREEKAQNPFASNGRYNLFRPLTAPLDLPKMPVFTGKIRTVWPRGHTSTIRPKVGPLADLSPRASLRGEVLGSGWVWVEARRIVPERHLGLWGRARGVQLGRVERQPEVPEHPLDGVTGCERGGDLHAAFAARALEDVGQEDSPNHGRPGKAPPRRLPAGDAAVRTRGYTRNRGDDGRHDSSAGGERRGEDAEVAGQVGPWTGHERDQALDQFMRREKERGRAVAPGTLELEFESAVVEAGEPVDGYRWARQIARHALEPLAIIRGHSGSGLEVEPFDLGAEATEHDGVEVRGRAADADDASTATRAGGAGSADRRLGYCREKRRCIDEILVGRARRSNGEAARDSSEYRRGHARDVLVCRSGRRMEYRRPAEGKAVNPVKKQSMEVRARAQRRVESLNYRHRPGLERTLDAEPPRAPSKPRRDRCDKLAQDDGGQRGIEHHPRAQGIGNGENPLPQRAARENAIHEMCREVGHPAANTARAKSAASTRKRDGPAPPAVATSGQDESVRQDSAPQERFDLRHDESRQSWRFGLGVELPEERLPVGLQRRIEDGLLWPVPFVAAGRETGADRRGARRGHPDLSEGN